jgi:hypothetical protein
MKQKEITTDAGAPQQIANYLRGEYPNEPELPAVTAEVQQLFATTIFPEHKADWRVYPNNIGHKDWLGCFRCHDEAKAIWGNHDKCMTTKERRKSK